MLIFPLPQGRLTFHTIRGSPLLLLGPLLRERYNSIADIVASGSTNFCWQLCSHWREWLYRYGVSHSIFDGDLWEITTAKCITTSRQTRWWNVTYSFNCKPIYVRHAELNYTHIHTLFYTQFFMRKWYLEQVWYRYMPRGLWRQGTYM